MGAGSGTIYNSKGFDLQGDAQGESIECGIAGHRFRAAKAVWRSAEKYLAVWFLCAGGDQTDESDIDVMALVDLSAGELARYRRQISDFSSNLDLKYGVLLAIKLQDRATFDFYGAASPFFQNVMREGVSLVS